MTYMFAIHLNCSSRFRGMKVIMLYFEVMSWLVAYTCSLSFGIKVILRQALMNIEHSWLAERSFTCEKIHDIEHGQAHIPTRTIDC